MKRLCERANGAESFRFSENLRAAVCSDQQNRNVWLQVEDVGNDFKAGDVRQIKIDDAEPEAPLSYLIDPVDSIGDEDDLVALRLEHEPERVANRRLIINYQDTEVILAYSVEHNSADLKTSSQMMRVDVQLLCRVS